jgi:hypothetical protein
MLFARTVIASVLTWMKLPAGASRPDKAELSNTPILPRRSRLFTAGVLTAGVVMLLLPMGRQAMTMVRDSWSGFQPSASERGELDKLATRAEEQEDAATLAFVALRLDDPARYAVLAGWLALQAVLDWSRFLLLEIFPSRFGSRRTPWRRSLCWVADYAPAVFLAASVVFLVSFIPYAHAFSGSFSWSNGFRNEDLIGDALSGLTAVPQFLAWQAALICLRS